MSDSNLPSTSRKQYQEALRRRRRQLRKRRRARIRRIRMLRTLRSVRFWMRTLATAFVLLCIVFWSKFAVVYNIPDFAARGPLQNVQAYVTVKPWWFGPPVFDLENYAAAPGHRADFDIANPYDMLLSNIGRYQGVLTHPQFVWVSRANHG